MIRSILKIEGITTRAGEGFAQIYLMTPNATLYVCMYVIAINQCQFSQVNADITIHKIFSIVASFAASL